MAMGDTDGVWGLQEHLTALTIDELRIANWQRQNEGVKESKQTRPPKPVPRPGITRRDKNSPERVAKRKAALERAAERRRAIASGAIT
jgi:hypothetical protein